MLRRIFGRGSRAAPLLGSLVGDELYRDALMTLTFAVHSDREIGDQALGGADWRVVRADQLTSPEPGTVPGRTGRWKEAWLVERAGHSRFFTIEFTPDATGTGISVQPPGPMTAQEAAAPAGVLVQLVEALQRGDDSRIAPLVTPELAQRAFAGAGSAAAAVLQKLGIAREDLEGLGYSSDLLCLTDGSVVFRLVPGRTHYGERIVEEATRAVLVHVVPRPDGWRVAGLQSEGDIAGVVDLTSLFRSSGGTS